MSETVESELTRSEDHEACCELLLLHRKSINKNFENGGKTRQKRVPVHPVLLNWAIVFLAKTSASIYKEVAKVMLLPDISYVYHKSRKLVSRSSDGGYTLHLETIHSVSRCGKKDKWTDHQRQGTIREDSANIKATLEHDNVTNNCVSGDESHNIGTLSRLFQDMARKVKGTDDGNDAEQSSNSTEKSNSILDGPRLA
ncbi:hypothetical protein ACHAWF_003182 [Thalassiosira exigua]